MEEVSIIGIDLAKRSFQVHGAKADGSVAYRRKLSRGKLLGFLASQPPCTVAMEACASAHYWGREIAALGHEVRLVPPIYVKPFVKRQKVLPLSWWAGKGEGRIMGRVGGLSQQRRWDERGWREWNSEDVVDDGRGDPLRRRLTCRRPAGVTLSTTPRTTTWLGAEATGAGAERGGE